MLLQKNRLKVKKDFTKLFSKGKVQHHKVLTLKVVKNGLKDTRVGFVISTKVSKHAVDRNKIKRRLRSILAKRIEEIPAGYDIAFIAKREAVPASFQDVEASVERLLEKAGMIPAKKE